MLQDIRYYGGIALLYIFTVGAVGSLFYTAQLFGTPTTPKHSHVLPYSVKPVQQSVSPITGQPVRIVIPASGIDLPIDDGHYNSSTDTWTLSQAHAQFAVMTAPPNDRAGTTFIYGHGTDEVFGKIGTHRPPVGTTATVYTDNGHEFTYALQDIRDLEPSDTSILQDTAKGPARLIVQTCTGVFSEWRTMFIFTFKEVH